MTKEEETFIDALYDYFGCKGINALGEGRRVYLNVTKTCNTGEVIFVEVTKESSFIDSFKGRTNGYDLANEAKGNR